MNVTDVTLGVRKQNLNAGLLQQHHFGTGLMAIFRVVVLLFAGVRSITTALNI